MKAINIKWDIDADDLSVALDNMTAKDAAEMLKGSTRVDKSNGDIFVTDEIKSPVWYGICPPVKVEADRYSFRDIRG